MHSRFRIIQTPWFILAVLILLLNDFLLKDYYHNWLTGKLSDFAGVFILPLFLSVLFPKQIKSLLIFTAAFFLYWKSPWSDGLIHTINTLPGFHYARVIDYSDLIALSMLPLSYLVFSKKESLAVRRVSPALSFSVTSIALLATSQAENFIQLDADYEIMENRSTLISRIQTDTSYFYTDFVQVNIDSFTNQSDTSRFYMHLNTPSLIKIANVYGYLWSIDSTGTGIHLSEYTQQGGECGFFRPRCKEAYDEKIIVQEEIEEYFIDLL